MSAFPFDVALALKSLPEFLKGLWVTLSLTLIVLVTGLALAVPMGLARMSQNRFVSGAAGAFVVFFRGAPLLILLYLVYYGLGQITTNKASLLWLIFGSAFSCAVIGLTLNHAAYMTEIVRGSLESVPAGLVEASQSLGLTPRETFVWIRLPLALRIGLKAYQNEVIMFIKGTAVVSVVTVTDITAVANGIFETTYDPLTPMLTAAAFYWALVNVVRLVFDALNRWMSRHLAPPPTAAATTSSSRVRSPGTAVATPAVRRLQEAAE